MPSSPFGRVMGFAQLGASLVYGTMSDSVSQYFSPKSTEQDTEKPANRYAVLPHSSSAKPKITIDVTHCNDDCSDYTALLLGLLPSVSTRIWKRTGLAAALAQ